MPECPVFNWVQQIKMCCDCKELDMEVRGLWVLMGESDGAKKGG